MVRERKEGEAMSLSLESIQKENPWNGLARRSPYVLRADAYHIDEYNRNRRTKPENNIHVDIPPTPFIGAPANVRVLLLIKNPVWSEEYADDFTDNAEFAQKMWQNLIFGNPEIPFYPIDPAFEETAAYQWWYPRLKELIEACDEKTGGRGRECVAHGLLAVSFFPYHVNDFSGEITELRCQKFTRELVRQYRDEDIPIVISGQPAMWTKALPKLVGRFYSAPSRQNGFLGRTSLPKGVFDVLVESLTRSDTEAPVREREVVGAEAA
jgi:hypothetical protein